MVLSSWWFERLKLLCQYFAVFLASMPAGFVYLFLIRWHFSRPVALIGTAPLGLALAYAAWNRIERLAAVRDASSIMDVELVGGPVVGRAETPTADSEVRATVNLDIERPTEKPVVVALGGARAPVNGDVTIFVSRFSVTQSTEGGPSIVTKNPESDEEVANLRNKDSHQRDRVLH